MKEEVRDSESAMAVFLRNCPEREYKRIIKYLYELTYFSIPDYNFVYYCIQHACKSNNIKPTDPLDWDIHHEFAGPTGPPGDGKMVNLDDHEKEFEVGPKNSRVVKKGSSIRKKSGLQGSKSDETKTPKASSISKRNRNAVTPVAEKVPAI
ncbi:hypothetical protein OSTOST_17804 [Ostertagia ostertagi]